LLLLRVAQALVEVDSLADGGLQTTLLRRHQHPTTPCPQAGSAASAPGRVSGAVSRSRSVPPQQLRGLRAASSLDW
jgi:hypothetical protein